jgi:hypothetical protein
MCYVLILQFVSILNWLPRKYLYDISDVDFDKFQSNKRIFVGNT